ncbi:DUF1223 domain-containing protein [Flavobacterium sp. MMLR14_040]|uniref:DUF1223 domain-containing protein n=1 Tax=Flavobacterium sp. MMLR14_040 TaxID=3093843 RepID=UPI0029902CB0|nr:DUF1223 domain-containing protein [Flavobacterium sp. MMLR14_040]MDW8852875.1 DUF1223 domain-containing protein [Flavobacterium sp. MMLR14_040]
MKKIKLIPILSALFLLAGITSFAQNNTNKKGFALLELFTSEGCSSCPPADELMGKIQNEYQDKNVYVLSYHVDYWDKQGWKDIFSNANNTKRQYDYAQFLGKEPIYTPQLIINGKTDYVGSQETIVRNAVKTALLKPANVALSLQANQTNNNLAINYSIEGNTKNSKLLLAIVQKSAKSNVKRGENAHRVLSHYQIVHQLNPIEIAKDKKGTAVIHLPKNFNTKDFEVIGFVQDLKTGSILGANKADFQSI